MDCFYIIMNKLKDPDYAVTGQIREYIEQSGRKAVLSVKDEEGHIVPGTVPEDADCALVLGGDGTLIRAVRDMDGSAMPLLGINMGTLGYLTDVELKEFRPALDRLFAGDFDVEERMMIEGVTADGYRDLAVNDIVLARDGKIRIVQFNLYVNGTLLNTYLADGVIISTPTGSTGYNLSAGGPVVEPTASMIVITPICSHALNTSSVVLSADDVIEVEICEGRYGRTEHVAVCFDGAEQLTLVTGDRVTIPKIIELISQYDIETQEELAEYLNNAGFKVTQATVSRDIRDLKLTKVSIGGRQKYIVHRPEEGMSEKYIRVLKDGYVSMDMAQNILVIKTVSGMAMAVAAALDAMKWNEVVGCIAGDDTIMCAIRTVDETTAVMEKIRRIVSKGL